MKRLVAVLGDQLFPDLAAEGTVFMREDPGLATRTQHHKQKIALFFSSMRHYALAHPGAIYDRWGRDQLSYFQRLTEVFREGEFDEIHLYEPADQFFLAAIEAWSQANSIPVKLHPNPSFITPRNEWPTKPPYRMADFYRRQRQRLGILMNSDGTPQGGRWSFDEENRKKLPKSLNPAERIWRKPDAITREVLNLVQSEFQDHPGELASFRWPVTRAEALEDLAQFIDQRFERFGPYEDAISSTHRLIYHSALSPALNMGLLLPQDLIRAATNSSAPLASREGFLRQIIGWREFIKQINQTYHERETELNQLNHQRRLNEKWWTGETGLPPIDEVIRRCREDAWCHHIERLMVIGATMLMAEVHPDEAYRWFMEMFIDSADWVMAPNVYGMSQFADGGLFATKPYLCGSAYILKMSDWGKGPWCDVWDGLYWRFVDRHRPLFAKNPRMSIAPSQLDRMAQSRRERIFTAAETWIDQVTVS